MYQSQPFRHRLLVYLLFVVFSYNTVCFHLTLWIWKAYMNEQIEEYATTLSNDKLVHFVLHTTEIEHELEVNGYMYDVIRYQKNETSVHYWCIPDFAENILAFQGDEEDSFSDAHHLWKGYLKNISKKVTQLYYSCIDIKFNAKPKNQVLVSSYLKMLQPKQVSVLTPPPRL